MRYLGIDLGTSSVKVLTCDAAGVPRAEASAAYPVLTPQPGQAESRPADWWSAVSRAVRQLPEGERQLVAAIGLSGQMHGFVPVDAAGNSLRNAILWSDTRAAAQLEHYRALPPALLRRLGNPVVTGMAGPGLLWLHEHEPALLARARFVLPPKDWLRLQLCGEAASEHSDASATLLYDVTRGSWSGELCAALNLDEALLPPLLEPREEAGRLLAAAADGLGLPAGIPVRAGAADVAAAAFGSGLTRGGDAQLTLGTGAQIVAITGQAEPEAAPVVHLFRAVAEGSWYRMAAMQNAGLALDWVRRTLGFSWEELYGSLDPAALQPDLLFFPYLTGERTPLLDPAARASWQGLHLGHTRRDMAAAALAGVALSVLAGFRALQRAGVNPPVLRVAGGGSADGTFVQLLCDLLEVPLAVSDVRSASALGAALLARGGPGEGERAPEVSHEPRALPGNVLALRDAFPGTAPE